jgi:hypothetical protein
MSRHPFSGVGTDGRQDKKAISPAHRYTRPRPRSRSRPQRLFSERTRKRTSMRTNFSTRSLRISPGPARKDMPPLPMTRINTARLRRPAAISFPKPTTSAASPSRGENDCPSGNTHAPACPPSHKSLPASSKRSAGLRRLHKWLPSDLHGSSRGKSPLHIPSEPAAKYKAHPSFFSLDLAKDKFLLDSKARSRRAEISPRSSASEISYRIPIRQRDAAEKPRAQRPFHQIVKSQSPVRER